MDSLSMCCQKRRQCKTRLNALNNFSPAPIYCAKSCWNLCAKYNKHETCTVSDQWRLKHLTPLNFFSGSHRFKLRRLGRQRIVFIQCEVRRFVRVRISPHWFISLVEANDGFSFCFRFLLNRVTKLFVTNEQTNKHQRRVSRFEEEKWFWTSRSPSSSDLLWRRLVQTLREMF